MDIVLFNTHDVVLLITIYQCVLFSLLVLILRKKTVLSNFLLVGFLLTTAAIPLDTLINFGAAFREWTIATAPHLFYVFEVGYWIQGPLLLWYVRSVIYKDFTLDWSDLVYLIPFLLFFLHQLVSYHALSADEKVSIQESYNILNEQSTIFFITLARELLRVFFGLMCLLELRRHRKLIENKHVNAHASDLTWIKLMAYGFLALWVWASVIASLIVLSVVSGVHLEVGAMGLISNYALCFLLGIILLVISSQSSAFSHVQMLSLMQKSIPKVAVNLEHVENLENVLESEKPYLDSNLTLESLATRLNISPRTLSTVINRHYGCNFFEFINGYRIRDAKLMLSKPENQDLSMLDVMHEVGFNSKATFNSFFKKIEGMTPREFKKRSLTDAA